MPNDRPPEAVVEITPAPSVEERAAILTALALAERDLADRPADGRSAWWRAGISEALATETDEQAGNFQP